MSKLIKNEVIFRLYDKYLLKSIYIEVTVVIETGNQLKGYIQRESKKFKISSNYGYNYYFTRVFLEELYKKNHNYILKGSIAQFTRLAKLERPITDIDLITCGKISDAKDIIDEVISNTNIIKFKILNQFTTTNATINYKILCDFDGKTGRISLDFKKDNSIDFSEVEMPNYFSKDKSFLTLSSSIEEHLASKLYVILLHLKLYSELSREFRRFKDFFDVHTILGSANIDQVKVIEILQRKIKEDEFLRDYELYGPLFKSDFIKDNQNNWDNDKKKYQFLTDTEFKDAVEVTNEYISKNK
ncbi:MAG: nucleotidyl transferase AbiEii/AbiGii toxin family protein [Bacilli bacterium]|nr:nucleotidyl transferase AbiEii/AbiGii toxin family protein [Bacilli bacterium]